MSASSPTKSSSSFDPTPIKLGRGGREDRFSKFCKEFEEKQGTPQKHMDAGEEMKLRGDVSDLEIKEVKQQN